ncbi:hypothetical protein SAY87_031952 [Trapa incisa]|uniref:DET1- and DDB1-associated protein 1 domain-containing protein n=1 Tax=Trapa incisa TaxID=236973 RepID=A0AAN7KR24_9MYRT|nr:hypothetical protein SAY87_031952 [Trapa incisa]
MDSLFGDWPSFDPHNFSHFRPSDPSNPSVSAICPVSLPPYRVKNSTFHCQKMTPTTYCPTHSRTLPPSDQIITTEAKNILIRNFYGRGEEKLRPKRAAAQLLDADHGSKQPRPCDPVIELID